MNAVRFHGAARAELLDEIRYYTSIGRRLGERLASEIEQATQLASEFPDMGSPYRYGTRRVFRRKVPFSIVYMVRESELDVLALAPFGRKPGYWHARKHDG